MCFVLKIYSFRWNSDRINHIAKHGIEQHEVEQAAFDDPHRLIKKSVVSYKNSSQYIYRLLGRTGEGRYLALFFIPQGRGIIYPVTARNMNNNEKRLYKGGNKR